MLSRLLLVMQKFLLLNTNLIYVFDRKYEIEEATSHLREDDARENRGEIPTQQLNSNPSHKTKREL